jgi:lipopolysaccharide transport system ATP-binding protein
MDHAVVVERAGKHFSRSHINRPKSLKEFVVRRLRWNGPRDRFWAVRGVSFSVERGRALGIIGANGSGKSTLLRLIGGVLRPDEGTVNVQGRVGALIDLGACFHPDRTGRENVFMAGVVAGLTRSQVLARFDSIVSFAELEAFIDSPNRTYSAGMQMRLGFSVAVHAEPEVFLIDEVLAVGDLAFQNKCLDRISELKSAGCAMVLVSHDLEKVKQFCDEALWVRSGLGAVRGDPKTVTEEYATAMTRETRRRTPEAAVPRRTPSGVELRVKENRFGSLEMQILDVRLLNSQGVPVSEMGSGDPLRIEIRYLAPEPVNAPVFGVNISNIERNDYFDINTDSMGVSLPRLEGEGKILLLLDRLDLKSGNYFVDVGVYAGNWEYAYDYHRHVYPLAIRSKLKTKGILVPPHRWELL